MLDPPPHLIAPTRGLLLHPHFVLIPATGHRGSRSTRPPTMTAGLKAGRSFQRVCPEHPNTGAQTQHRSKLRTATATRRQRRTRRERAWGRAPFCGQLLRGRGVRGPNPNAASYWLIASAGHPSLGCQSRRRQRQPRPGLPLRCPRPCLPSASLGGLAGGVGDGANSRRSAAVARKWGYPVYLSAANTTRPAHRPGCRVHPYAPEYSRVGP